jgi:hypothetical protein
VEGTRRKDGSLVTFHSKKKNGKKYAACDECVKHWDTKNKDPDTGNAKVKRLILILSVHRVFWCLLCFHLGLSVHRVFWNLQWFMLEFI